MTASVRRQRGKNLSESSPVRQRPFRRGLQRVRLRPVLLAREHQLRPLHLQHLRRARLAVEQEMAILFSQVQKM
jgi:hypothetical protein